MEKITEFDPAEYLDTEEAREDYLACASEEGTPEEILKAISDVARARGMAKTAREAGITREGLYKALSPEGNPAFATVCKILNAIGCSLTLSPKRTQNR